MSNEKFGCLQNKLFHSFARVRENFYQRKICGFAIWRYKIAEKKLSLKLAHVKTRGLSFFRAVCEWVSLVITKIHFFTGKFTQQKVFERFNGFKWNGKLKPEGERVRGIRGEKSTSEVARVEWISKRLIDFQQWMGQWRLKYREGKTNFQET